MVSYLNIVKRNKVLFFFSQCAENEIGYKHLHFQNNFVSPIAISVLITLNVIDKSRFPPKSAVQRFETPPTKLEPMMSSTICIRSFSGRIINPSAKLDFEFIIKINRICL